MVETSTRFSGTDCRTWLGASSVESAGRAVMLPGRRVALTWQGGVDLPANRWRLFRVFHE